MDIKSIHKLMGYLNKNVINIILLFFLVLMIFLNLVNKNGLKELLFITIIIGLFIKLSVLELNSILLIYRIDKVIEKIDENEDINCSIEDFNKEGFYSFCTAEKKTYKAIDNIVLETKNVKKEALKNEKLTELLIMNTAINLKEPIALLTEKSEVLSGNKEKDFLALEALEKECKNIKKIVNNLFESSKLNSGIINVNKKPLEINYILKQGIAEYKGEFEKSNLILEKNLLEKKILIDGNAEKLGRVIEILFENVIKHSQQFTRVYIETKVDEKNYKLIIKNISKESLNFSVEEFYERLKLKKNSTGLQLESVKSIVKSLDGSFNLFIDGDLFKTEILFKLGGAEIDNK